MLEEITEEVNPLGQRLKRNTTPPETSKRPKMQRNAPPPTPTIPATG
jgi:hypothetical protein